MIDVEEFVERRDKLYSKLEDNSVLILFAGIGVKQSEDENYDFYCNRSFYYYTNILQEGSCLICVKADSIVKEYLFIQPFNEVKEKWTGKLLTIDEAKTLSGINNVLTVNEFNPRLSEILDRKKKLYGEINNIYLDMATGQKYGEDENGEALNIRNFAFIFKANYKYLNVIDVNRIILEQRMVKTIGEVEELKEAIVKTNLGLKKIMSQLKPGLKEFQLSATFFYTIQDLDKSELAFPTISSSGVNSTCLHYTTSMDEIKNGDLVQLDLGAKHNGYCADISRVYPANGKFTPLQRKIYEIVLNCNKLVIKIVKPGVILKDLNAMVTNYLAEECLKAGLIKDKADIKNYYFHSVSHHIGLDTHDLSDRSLPLQAGNIISDEPGLYFKELGIGVRIEDDLLVTENGCICLSNDIIKEVNDIERALIFKK